MSLFDVTLRPSSRTLMILESRALLEIAVYGECQRPQCHRGLGHNSMTLFVIGDRLAHLEDDWIRFERKGLKKLLYPDPKPLRKAEGVAW